LSYGNRLRNLGLPTLQYRRIRADLVETQNHPQCRQGRLPTYFQSEKQIIEVINLKYLKNGQSLDLVSLLKLSSHDFVDHVAHDFKAKKKKRNIKMIFLKTILIQLPCNPFKYIFVHMRQKKTIQSLVVCVMQKYRLL
jgi:hypothetical protein